MTQRVVDVLEAIQIHDQQRETGVVALRGQDRLLESVTQQGPVG